MVVADDGVDVPVPRRRPTFAAVKVAQTRRDLQVLAWRGRPILRIHLGPDVVASLDRRHDLVEEATKRCQRVVSPPSTRCGRSRAGAPAASRTRESNWACLGLVER